MDRIIKKILFLLIIFLIMNFFNISVYAKSTEKYEKSLSAGGFFTMGINKNNLINSWGDNNKYQLGLNHKIRMIVPGNLNSIPEKIKEVSSGRYHSLILTMNNNVFVTGGNYYGQLGLGHNKNSKVTQLNISDVKKVYAGDIYEFSAILLNDGTVLTAGNNFHNQLGHTEDIHQHSNTFKKVKGLSNVKELAIGGSFIIALKENGNLESWGFNYHGQLGHGDNDIRKTPTPINGISNIDKIYAGGNHVFAKTKSNQWYVWGDNTSGQLGLGDYKNRYEPTLLGREDIYNVSLGTEHSIALTQKKEVLTCGDNLFYQLGIENLNDVSTFKKIEGLSEIYEVEAGTFYSLVLNNEGQIFGWGDNESNQISYYFDTAVKQPTLIKRIKLRIPYILTLVDKKENEIKRVLKIPNPTRNELDETWNILYDLEEFDALYEKYYPLLMNKDSLMRKVLKTIEEAKNTKIREDIVIAKNNVERMSIDNKYRKDLKTEVDMMVLEYNMNLKYGDLKKITRHYVKLANVNPTDYYLKRANYFLYLSKDESLKTELAPLLIEAEQLYYGQENFLLLRKINNYINYYKTYNQEYYLEKAESYLRDLSISKYKLVLLEEIEKIKKENNIEE